MNSSSTLQIENGDYMINVTNDQGTNRNLISMPRETARGRRVWLSTEMICVFLGVVTCWLIGLLFLLVPRVRNYAVALSVGTVSFAMLMFMVYLFIKKRKPQISDIEDASRQSTEAVASQSKFDTRPQNLVAPNASAPEPIIPHILTRYTYEELRACTDDFSPSNKLGEGGFGYVHKGVMPQGTQVAVKQLKQELMNRRHGEAQFHAEVETISRIHHRHLVKLIGYCISGQHRIIVYEFVRNNSLKFHLHDCTHGTLSWEHRMKIARGTAKGLAYLHHDCKPRIIHRDIKGDNILLEDDFHPKIADFGLARFIEDEVSHQTSIACGTHGYIAPECVTERKVSDKSDVFAFGVTLLELITGRRAIFERKTGEWISLANWARGQLKPALDAKDFRALADPKMKGDYKSGEMACIATCALASISLSSENRPEMVEILRALDSLDGNRPLLELNNIGNPPPSSNDTNSRPTPLTILNTSSAPSVTSVVSTLKN